MADDHRPGASRPFEQSFGDATVTGRQVESVAPELAGDYPLVIAIHGGGYSSAYFDLPGLSLLDRAQAIGVPVIAIDRPGYAGTTPLPPEDCTIERTAGWLNDIIGQIWQRHGGQARGVFLIGHSIGGAMAISVAAQHPSWPLLGIAISGVGLSTPDRSRENAFPDTPFVTTPPAVKDQLMFGPDWTYAPDVPALSHQANAPGPRAELVDIVFHWHHAVRQVAAEVEVPVHYRQGEFDRLWIGGPEQAAGFGAAFTRSRRVDCRRVCLRRSLHRPAPSGRRLPVRAIGLRAALLRASPERNGRRRRRSPQTCPFVAATPRYAGNQQVRTSNCPSN